MPEPVPALLNEEPGAEVVLDHLAGALVSTVNVAEAAAKLLEAGELPAVTTDGAWKRVKVGVLVVVAR